MSSLAPCPQCNSEYSYEDGLNLICPECGHEWPAVAAAEGEADDGRVIKDSVGNVLNDGDTITVIKDLKVKGSSIPLKQGTVIKSIRLVEDDAEHIEGNSDKIKGLVLKTCFLRKA